MAFVKLVTGSSATVLTAAFGPLAVFSRTQEACISQQEECVVPTAHVQCKDPLIVAVTASEEQEQEQEMCTRPASDGNAATASQLHAVCRAAKHCKQPFR